ncbi:MAG: nickel-dependent hydrogenase large subunit [Aigarchaeota archaeon]|nr:nickel-dependent hydrogenase large subunit [Aigarchaeota archaeon]MCX8193699.1 nickel-dependent hydrogenase large subunit [Nitrososphaeria archaeon]MDW7987056.1 nickel-dependent hydrogenase large subunit [Nitrososphaerota archaeon]
MSGTVIRLVIGPQHPALKEPERFILELEGEQVVRAIPRIGYVHRGIEKAMESRTYIQNLYLVERVCGICSHAHSICYTQAIEELLEVEVPPRARYIRTIFAELERINSHLLWLGLIAHEVGFDTFFMYIWRDRELIMDILEELSGNRVHYAVNTIGGVRRDLDHDKASKILKRLEIIEERIKRYIPMLEREQTLLKRTLGIGPLSQIDAIKYGAVGPMARASGVKRDVRKDDPYAAYDELSFNIITLDDGDCFSRIMIRAYEILESIEIIRESLSKLPDGEIRVKVKLAVPPSEALSRVEAPRGELIHYARSNGTDKPERYKIRAPTLANLATFSKILVGAYLADVPVILAGIDPCFSCMDRMQIIDLEKNEKNIWTIEDLRRYAREWYQRR